MITKIPHSSTARCIKPYQVHMVHAALKKTVNPISSYSYQPLLMKQQTWQKEMSLFLSAYNTHTTALTETASQLHTSQKNSIINSQTTASSDPTALTAKASNESGIPHSFAVFDIEGEAVGLTQVKTKSQDALFMVNGEKHSSPTNTLKLDDELEVTMHQESNIPVQLDVKANTPNILSNPLSPSPFTKALAPNPYHSYLLPQLFYQEASAKGLFFNEIF